MAKTIGSVTEKGHRRGMKYILILCCFYLGLKICVNPEPLISIDSAGIHLGLFNFNYSVGQSDHEANWSLLPLERIDPYQTSLTGGHPLSWGQRDKESGIMHLMGTDHLGRDLFAGWLSGFEVALLIGILTAMASGLLSTLLACLGAYAQRFRIRVNRSLFFLFVLLGLIDLMMLFWWISGIYPAIYFIVGFILFVFALFFLVNAGNTRKHSFSLGLEKWNGTLFGFIQPIPDIILLAILSIGLQGTGIWGIIIILTLFRVPGNAWYLQGAGAPVMSQEFITQARVMGIQPWRLIRYHLLPGIMPHVRLLMALTAGRAVIAESTLSFLGIGPTSELMTWGHLIQMGLTDYRYIGVALMSLVGLIAIQWIFKRAIKEKD